MEGVFSLLSHKKSRRPSPYAYTVRRGVVRVRCLFRTTNGDGLSVILVILVRSRRTAEDQTLPGFGTLWSTTEPQPSLPGQPLSDLDPATLAHFGPLLAIRPAIHPSIQVWSWLRCWYSHYKEERIAQ